MSNVQKRGGQRDRFSSGSLIAAAYAPYIYIGSRVPRTRACCIHIPESPWITGAVANGRTVSRFSSERAGPPGRFAPAHPYSGGLGSIGTHIGILLPGLRPVIARFSAISHSRLCELRRDAPVGRRRTVGARISHAPNRRTRLIPCYEN